MVLLPLFALWASSTALVAPPSAAAPSGSSSAPSSILAHAREVMGFDTLHGRVLHLHAATAVEQPYQSDRTYPPFFSNFSTDETWFNPETRVERTQSRVVYPGNWPSSELLTLDDGEHAQLSRDGKAAFIHRSRADARNLDPWAVLADWSAAKDVRVMGRETYRDYPRMVLGRRTAEGPQRLFVDPKSGYPVKLEFVEPHYLWGQRRVEYVWSTWIRRDGVSYPGAAFRVVDGEVEASRTNGESDLLSATATPGLTLPPAPAEPPPALPLFLQPLPPKPIQVTETVWLLSNPGYNEVAAAEGGELFILDSTQGEDRARQDDEAIQKLFPGPHHVNLVVTDLAWPHVAGLRYWVAKGATIISHRAARRFLQQVIDRRWTEAPDLLERERAKNPGRVRLRFVPVDRPTDLAGGRVRVVPIDGPSSEVALMVYLPGEKFLWGSDFIQTLDAPSQYGQEVMAAAARAGIQPERFAAEHLSLATWKALLQAQVVSTPK